MKHQIKNWKGELVTAPEDHKHVVMNIGEGMIVWSSTKAGTHRVRYGLYVAQFAGELADVEAAKEFGLAVRHWKECEGGLKPEAEERFTTAQIEHASDILKHVENNGDTVEASRKKGVDEPPIYANKWTLNALVGYGAITCRHYADSISKITVKDIDRLTQIANALPND